MFFFTGGAQQVEIAEWSVLLEILIWHLEDNDAVYKSITAS